MGGDIIGTLFGLRRLDPSRYLEMEIALAVGLQVHSPGTLRDSTAGSWGWETLRNRTRERLLLEHGCFRMVLIRRSLMSQVTEHLRIK